MDQTFRDWLLPQAEKLPNHPYTMHAHHLIARHIRATVTGSWTAPNELHDLIHGTPAGRRRILDFSACDLLNQARIDYRDKDLT